MSLSLAISLAAPHARANVLAAPSEEDAAALFESGRYDEAIAAFEELFKETDNPNYLFNIGRIYEDDGQLEKAVEYYERFKLARGVELELRTEASRRSKALQAILDSEDGAPEPAAAAVSPAETEDSSAAVDSAGSGAEPPPAADDDPAPPRGPSRLALTGYILTGVGGAALIAGGVVGAMAQADDADLSGPVEDPVALRDRGQRRAWTADGLFIGGGVVLGTGVALIIVDVVRRKKSASASASQRSLRLTGGPGLIGVGLQGRL